MNPAPIAKKLRICSTLKCGLPDSPNNVDQRWPASWDIKSKPGYRVCNQPDIR
jgi:hypothetical protein